MHNSVTVIIPTRNRAGLVVRAVTSALEQTHRVEQVIVVVDGPDDSTVAALAALEDARVRTIVLPACSGSNYARNHGARHARSEWLAFLDDDDEWLAHKLETQLARAHALDILSCRFVSSSAHGTMVWPKRLPEPGETFGDYLFSRRSLFNGEAAIITSTLLVRKTVFDRMPFSTTLRRHQDADWVIRSIARGARFAYVPAALVRFNDDIGRVRISTSYDWRQSLQWIRSVRAFLGRRAYAGFVLASVGPAASDRREWQAFPLLLREAWMLGSPTFLHLMLYLGMWAFPQRARQQVRSLFTALQRGSRRLPLNRDGTDHEIVSSTSGA